MNVSEPSSAVVPSLDGPVLLVLARTTTPLSARAVARLARRGSPAGINKTLRRLTAEGLVSAQPAEPSILYSLNRKHLAAPAVEALADIRNELIRRIRDALSQWEHAPVFASLFGSAARGDGDTASDIDLFLVRSDTVEFRDRAWWDQVGRLTRDIRDWTGNNASVTEVALDELSGPGAASIRGVVRDILEEGVELYGKPPVEMIGLSG